MIEQSISIERLEEAVNLFGAMDENRSEERRVGKEC